MRITAVLTRVGPGLHFKEPAAVSVPLAHTASLGEDGPAPSPSSSSSPTVCVLTPESELCHGHLLPPWAGPAPDQGFHAGPSGGLDAAQGPAMGHHFVRIPVSPAEQEASGKIGLCLHHDPAQGRPSAQGRGFSGQEQRDGQSPGGSLLRDPFS